MSNQLINKPLLGTPLNRSHPLAQGLRYALLFNENGGNKIYNSGNLISPYNYLGYLYYTNWIGNGLKFNQAATTPLCHGRLGIWPGYNKFTIASSLYYFSYASIQQIVTADNSTTGQRSFQFRVSASYKLELITFTSNNPITVTGNTTLGNNIYHCVGVCDGINDLVYLNGNVDNITSAGLCDNDAAAVIVGARTRTVDYSDVVEPSLHHIYYIYMWDKALTPSEIQSLYIDPYQMFRPSMPYWFWSSLGGVSYTLDCSGGAVTIAGGSAGLLCDRLLNGQAGAVTVAGGDAAVLKDSLLSGSTGAVTVDGGGADLLKDSLLAGQAGAVTIDGGGAALLKDSLLIGTGGTITVAGGDAEIVWNLGGSTYVLDCLSGQVTVAGGDADLLKAHLLTGTGATVALAGLTADLILTRVLAGNAGAVEVVGGDAVLLCDRLLTAGAASVTLAGGQAILVYSEDAFVPAAARTVYIAAHDRVIIIPVSDRTIYVEE